ncbi:MAG: sulfotransferase domain-containing protein [Pirellulales bacterium]|nr:sulfotransferase domain-containing protein [Pirellulales bacterium]
MVTLNRKPLVDFLIIGAQKSGTTSLWAYLRTHPDLFLPKRKELHFFDKEEFFRQAVPQYEKYHLHFSKAQAGQLCGEATPSYVFWESAAERIVRYNPEMKLVLILRNPIQRAYSHWNMERKRGNEKLSFLQAVQAEKSLTQPMQDRVRSYVARGYYSKQIKHLGKFFPAEQLLVLRSESLLQDRHAVLQKICNFLGVSNIGKVAKKLAHKRSYPRPMNNSEWEKLFDIFDQELADLEQLLGWNCDTWRQPPRELVG